MRMVLPFACAHILFKTAQYILTPVFFAQGRFWLDSVLDSGSVTLEKIFAFLFFVVIGTDYYFAGLMVGELVMLLSAIWFLRRFIARFRLRHLAFADAFGRVRAYFPAYQRVFFRRGLRQVDRLVIALMLPLVGFANYHLARQLAQPLRYVVRGLADPLMVRLAADKDLDHHARDRRVYHAIAILLPLLVAALSPWLMRAVYGPEYAAAWPIMAVLAVSYIFYGLSEYHLAVVVMLGDGEEPVRLEAIAGLVGIVTSMGMIVVAGEFGAPSGQVIHLAMLYLGGRVVTRRMLSRARQSI